MPDEKTPETTQETTTYYTEPEKPIRVNVYEFFKNLDEDFDENTYQEVVSSDEESEKNEQYYEDLFYMEEQNNYSDDEY